jgi:hypothetical protein
MKELLPVAIGAASGLLAGPRPGRWRGVAYAFAALGLGVLVSWAVGELADSFAFAFFDAGVALGAFLLTVSAQRVLRREGARTDPSM